MAQKRWRLWACHESQWPTRAEIAYACDVDARREMHRGSVTGYGGLGVEFCTGAGRDALPLEPRARRVSARSRRAAPRVPPRPPHTIEAPARDLVRVVIARAWLTGPRGEWW